MVKNLADRFKNHQTTRVLINKFKAKPNSSNCASPTNVKFVKEEIKEEPVDETEQLETPKPESSGTIRRKAWRTEDAEKFKVSLVRENGTYGPFSLLKSRDYCLILLTNSLTTCTVAGHRKK